jgi:hypothetical protein
MFQFKHTSRLKIAAPVARIKLEYSRYVKLTPRKFHKLWISYTICQANQEKIATKFPFRGNQIQSSIQKIFTTVIKLVKNPLKIKN